mmetsp:Transcript_12928/g.20036  ORF Transcript_12928/g.20036 Transcript_12928/m.20036 type:complete len:107 (-) Transcript_12928:93-413(-)
MGPKKKAGGDPVKGKDLYDGMCAACHDLSAHSVGPSLGGIGGENIASSPGYAYSSALSAKATLKWTPGTMDKWLKSPASFAPGNAMGFAGVADKKDRQDLCAFLLG